MAVCPLILNFLHICSKNGLFLLIILASQTFYPNWPIFLHGYIRHIRVILSLSLSLSMSLSLCPKLCTLCISKCGPFVSCRETLFYPSGKENWQYQRKMEDPVFLSSSSQTKNSEQIDLTIFSKLELCTYKKVRKIFSIAIPMSDVFLIRSGFRTRIRIRCTLASASL